MEAALAAAGSTSHAKDSNSYGLQKSSQIVPGTGEVIAKSGRKRRICSSQQIAPYFSAELAFDFVTCGRITSSRQVLYSDGV